MATAHVETAGATATNAPAWATKLRARIFRAKPRAGSGLPARTSIRVLVWVRRFVQGGALAAFLYLLFQTAFRGSFAATDARVRMPLRR